MQYCIGKCSLLCVQNSQDATFLYAYTLGPVRMDCKLLLCTFAVNLGMYDVTTSRVLLRGHGRRHAATATPATFPLQSDLACQSPPGASHHLRVPHSTPSPEILPPPLNISLSASPVFRSCAGSCPGFLPQPCPPTLPQPRSLPLPLLLPQPQPLPPPLLLPLPLPPAPANVPAPVPAHSHTFSIKSTQNVRSAQPRTTPSLSLSVCSCNLCTSLLSKTTPEIVQPQPPCVAFIPPSLSKCAEKAFALIGCTLELGR